MATYLDETGLEHVWGKIKTELNKKENKAIWVDMGTINSLPVTKAVEGITTDMVCAGAELGTPYAQMSVWEINTDTPGHVTVSGVISSAQTTTLKILLVQEVPVVGS